MARLDTSALNPAPVPTRSAEWVLVNECQDNWHFAPASMTDITGGQMICLGKLYDWKLIRKQDGGVPQKMLKTNDSVLAPLRQRNLITINKFAYYRITEQGRRVYDLNYWRNKVFLDEHRERKRRELEARKTFRFGGSVNLSEPRQFNKRR